MTVPAQARGFVALLRLPYWLMTGGLSLLTAFAITKNPLSLSIQTVLLVFFSMALITSAGFAINDFFDRESDAVIKPKRPIPSGALSLKQVVAVSGVLFTAGLVMAFFINWLSFVIIAADSALLLIYSMLVKRKSGFIANVLVGVLTGTAFLYGEATVSNPPTVSIISLSLYPIALGTIGGNVLRDILSLDGDTKIGYPTLPQKIGISKSAKVAAAFFLLTGLFAPLPFFVGSFSVYYLLPILVWSVLLIYSSVRLVTVSSTVSNVRKYERIVTMSMILLPLALILQALSHAVGGIL
ncbi:MAG TPA: geranylgeranylglycerol-phosphate geranylgeranyltransferase [Candidatus Limnocylindrales bacterium]|nr:geranylgeranylglycerol-phosphate geranylgeranyltransferase [Candidatus Limnocylindrales bacterium]